MGYLCWGSYVSQQALPLFVLSNSNINGTLKALSAVSQGPPGLSTAVSNHKTNSRMIAEKAVTKGSDMWGDIAVKVGSALGSYAAEARLAMLLSATLSCEF